MENNTLFPEHFITAAQFFCANFLTLTPGTYQHFEDVVIELHNEIKRPDGAVVRTHTRVNMDGLPRVHIQVSKSANKGSHPDFIFFLLLWCYARFANQLANAPSDMRADSDAMEFCKGTGRSVNDILNNFLVMATEYNNEGLTKRYFELKTNFG